MAAVSMAALVALIGGSIEVSRAYMVRDRLQAACDAAVLVGRKSVGANGFDGEALTQAKRYFAVNFDEKTEGASGTVFNATSPDNGKSVKGAASTVLSTVVMKFFGKDSIALSVDCSAAMGVGNIDVTMVLDTTGSMAGTKIAGLRTAMKSFYDNLKAATAGSDARVRYAFVPYSSSVNVGRVLYRTNPDYLADRNTIQSKVPIYKKITVKEQIGWKDPVITYDEVAGADTAIATRTRWNGTKYRTASECRRYLPSDTDWTNTGAPHNSGETVTNSLGELVTTKSVVQPQTSTQYDCFADTGLYVTYYYIYTWEGRREYYKNTIETRAPIYDTVEKQEFAGFEYRAHEWDTSQYKTFATVSLPLGDNGGNLQTRWKGCIEERQTVATATFDYSPLLGISPSDAFDLNIDMIPDASDRRTQWAPAWDEVAYYRLTSGKVPTSAQVSAYGKKAELFCPAEARLLEEMSEKEFDDYADSLNAEGSTYHDLGMIWGGRVSSPDGIFADTVNKAPANGGEVSRHIIFMTDGKMEPNNLIYSAYGIQYLDRRIIQDGTNQPVRHTLRFRVVCDAVKAKGIRIWVIAFGTGMTPPLQLCASDNSAFIAESTADLTEAFSQIARQVGELRIVN